MIKQEAAEKISYIITAFETYALGDIRKVQKNEMPIAAFILSVCFIDQISGFIYNAKKKGQRTNTERSKKFVAEYINKVASKAYDKDELIELLRNKLVHNYSLSDRKIPNHRRYQLEYFNPKVHLYSQGDIVFINIDGFVSDLENAFQHYKGKLLNDEAMQKNAIEHYDNFGVLVHREISIQLENA
jgi:hypothetical protein